MSIRLSKVVKDLNVGLSTAVEFLQKKGQNIDANPNSKITDEQYAMLVTEFSKDKNLKIESEKFSQQRQVKEKAPTVAIDGFDEVEPVEKKKEEEVEIITIKIEEKDLPQIKTVGKIDLENLNKKAEKKVEKTIEKPIEKPVEKKEPQPAPVVIDKVEEKIPEPPKKEEAPEIKAPVVQETVPPVVVAETPKVEEKVEVPTAAVVEPVEEPVQPAKAEVEIFSLGTPRLKHTPKVIDKIDLSAINDKTRPDKKTKEEKKKEREARERQLLDLKKQQQLIEKEKSDKLIKANGGKVPESAPSPSAIKKKRARISPEKVDINKGGNAGNSGNSNSNYGGRPAGGFTLTKVGAGAGAGTGGGSNSNKPRFKKTKVAVNEVDVQKQIKETLARLTEKKVKGSKYRREKRDNVSARQSEQEEQDRLEDQVLKLTEFVTANELAAMMNVSVNQVIATCMSLGIMVSINQRLDAETINIVAEEFGYKTEFVSSEVIEAIGEDEEDLEEDLVTRPPIVTVMGHVDHGKTSLLDYIRKANVIAGEAGGITQHIGAYNVKLEDGRRITFLDTPGHEAFTAMRARGAKVTDLAIIIVAADDAVMPQTVEAINHASAAGVPMVFAINKIDKDGANPDRIKEALAGMNYLVEEWGGKYQSQDISAKKGLHVKDLLEKVLLEAELLDLKANPKRKAVGSVIESSLDKGRGYISTVLVHNGTLKVGDVVLAGPYFGKVKAMFNERNQRITEARPSEPALILGLNGAPQAGDNINVMGSEHEARDIANKREQLQREQGLRTSRHLTLDEIGRRIALGNFQELNVIVKGDVDGSIEALSDSLIKLSTEEIQVNVIHKAVGAISESDIMLAAASNAIVIGFQVRPSQAARKLAEKEEIDIRLYSIIYDAIEELKSAMEGMLSPDMKEEIVATVEVREVFKITKVGSVAGCMVKEGKIKRTSKIRLIRDGIVVYTGELGSLKRFKDDVKEVAHGYECGLNIVNYNDIRVDDLIEAYEMTEVKKTL
ncbi:MAG: translation initiation factor IF-2 [Paludibacteraceae bacterium]|nr:translation initiation factor IF-2 [Paludibacteraceae bacterium]